MNDNLNSDPWYIVEEGFLCDNPLDPDTVFCLDNGYLKQSGNFEEYYSGVTLPGSFIAGKIKSENTDQSDLTSGNDVPTNKYVNTPNWIGITVRLNEEKLDLAVWEVLNFKRTVNLREGLLERSFEALSPKGYHIQVVVKRFLSMAESELGAISYSIKSLNFTGRISFMPVIEGDLMLSSQNVPEPVWNVLQTKTQHDVAHLWTQTRHTDFHICTALTYEIFKNNEYLNINPIKIEKEKIAGFSVGADVKTGDTLRLYKYLSILNSINHPRTELTELACILALEAKQKGWKKLFEEHKAAMTEKMDNSTSINADNLEE
jgi:maltose phosphorylase